MAARLQWRLVAAIDAAAATWSLAALEAS